MRKMDGAPEWSGISTSEWATEGMSIEKPQKFWINP